MSEGSGSRTHPGIPDPSSLDHQGGDPGEYPGLEVMSPTLALDSFPYENKATDPQNFSIGTTDSSPPGETMTLDAGRDERAGHVTSGSGVAAAASLPISPDEDRAPTLERLGPAANAAGITAGDRITSFTIAP